MSLFCSTAVCFGLNARRHQAILQNICIEIFTNIIVFFRKSVNISIMLRVFCYVTLKKLSSKMSPMYECMIRYILVINVTKLRQPNS